MTISTYQAGTFQTTAKGRRGLCFGKAGMAGFPDTKIPAVLMLPGEFADGSEWLDSSGNARDYTQATGSKQPGIGTIGTVGSLDFDGTDDLLTSSYTPGGSLGEVWGVLETDDLESGGDGVWWGTADHQEAGSPGTGYNRQLCTNQTATNPNAWMIFTPNNNPNTTYFSGDTSLTDSNPFLVRIWSTDANYKIEVDGVDQTLTLRSSPNGSDDGDWWSLLSGTLDSSTIGAHKRSVEVNHHNGRIGFVAVWDGENLSASVSALWTALLLSAFGIS